MLLSSISLLLLLLLRFQTVKGCRYVFEHFGPFIEAVVPIKDYHQNNNNDVFSSGNGNNNLQQQQQQQQLVLVKFMVMSTLRNVTRKYAVLNLDGVQDQDSDDSDHDDDDDDNKNKFIVDVIDDSKNDTEWQLEGILNDEYLHNEYGISLYPPPIELTLQEVITEWGWTTTGGTLINYTNTAPDDDDDDHQSQSSSTTTSTTTLLYKLTVLGWPHAKIEILAVGKNDDDDDDDGNQTPPPPTTTETTLLSSVLIEFEKPVVDDDYSDDAFVSYNEIEWIDVEDPSILLSDDDISYLSEHIIYYYSPKLDRFYIYYMWPKFVHVSDCIGCEYQMLHRQHMVSIYEFDDESTATATTTTTTTTVSSSSNIIEIKTVTASNVKGLDCLTSWDISIYDDAQILRFSGCSNCHNYFYVYYDTDSAVMIGHEGLTGPRDFQRSIIYYDDNDNDGNDTSEEVALTYYQPSNDYYHDETICFEESRYVSEEEDINICAAFTPRNFTIRECYLSNPDICTRTIQLNDEELYDKLIPLSYWPPPTATTTENINNTNDVTENNKNDKTFSSPSSPPRLRLLLSPICSTILCSVIIPTTATILCFN